MKNMVWCQLHAAIDSKLLNLKIYIYNFCSYIKVELHLNFASILHPVTIINTLAIVFQLLYSVFTLPFLP